MRQKLTQLLQVAERDFPNATVLQCAESGCRLGLKGLPDRVVFKGELLEPKAKICDCIIVAAVNAACVVSIAELKGRTTHASEIAEKLQRGTDYAIRILAASEVMPDHWCHIVLAKRWDTSEWQTLTKKHSIRVGSRRYPIIPRRCGEELTMILHILGSA